MKKFALSTLALLFSFALLFYTIPSAFAVTSSLSGTTSVRAGDTVKVTFSVAGGSYYGIQGTISYDSRLSLTGSSWSTPNKWQDPTLGSGAFANWSNDGNNAFGGGTLFTLTFKVADSVSTGDTLSVSVTGLIGSDGSSTSVAINSASWSASVAASLSGNANLGKLSCSDATLSPGFSKSTTSYSVTVPYEVTKLNLSYSTEDSGASVNVSGNDLSVGINTVSVTCTAANGSTKRYTITVTREQDPNYAASTDASLSSITVSAGQLSPAFDPQITDYVLYLPYESQSISATGTANDPKALSVSDNSLDSLSEGENLLTVVCMAEDAKTELTYTIHVIRMPVYAGVLPTITVEESESETELEPESEISTLSIPSEISLPLIGTVSIWIPVVVALFLLLALAYIVGTLVGKAVEKRKVPVNNDLVPDPKVFDTPSAETDAVFTENTILIPCSDNTPADENEKGAENISENSVLEVTSCVNSSGTDIPGNISDDSASAHTSLSAEKENEKHNNITSSSESDIESMSLDDILEDIKNM